MTDKKKPEEIADEHLDISAAEGGPGAIDAFRTGDVKLGTDSVSLNPSRTYHELDAKEQVMLNPSRTYLDPKAKL